VNNVSTYIICLTHTDKCVHCVLSKKCIRIHCSDPQSSALKHFATAVFVSACICLSGLRCAKKGQAVCNSFAADSLFAPHATSDIDWRALSTTSLQTIGKYRKLSESIDLTTIYTNSRFVCKMSNTLCNTRTRSESIGNYRKLSATVELHVCSKQGCHYLCAGGRSA
jgi:hypothetical protein